MKYIVITGGVVSGVGKGVVASSIGCILKNSEINVTFIKIDPYLNFDASNLSPNDHGEVFVLSDGGEVDLDFGNYERFMHINLKKHNSLTTGKVYEAVISKERAGFFEGQTVQAVPHLTDYIIEYVQCVASQKVLNGRECNSAKINKFKSSVFNHNTDQESTTGISRCNKTQSAASDIHPHRKFATHLTNAEDTNRFSNDDIEKETFDDVKVVKSDIEEPFVINSHAQMISENLSLSVQPENWKNSKKIKSFQDSSKLQSVKKLNAPSKDSPPANPQSDLDIAFTDIDESLTDDIEILKENGLCGHRCVNSLVDPEVCIIELGGTVGDIESSLFVEALRQLKNKVGSKNFLTIGVEYIPILSNGEIKTKPVQNSVIRARGLGLQPDILVLRCTSVLNNSCLQKISNFCEIGKDNIFHSKDVPSVYLVPEMLDKQNIGTAICNRLSLIPKTQSTISNFFSIINNKNESIIKIGIVGKYTKNPDTYISLQNALLFSGAKNLYKVDIDWIDAERLENDDQISFDILNNCHGIIVAGGFGKRGIEGKIKAITFARENKIACLGICLGFQLQIIEYARNILGFTEATSEEFHPFSDYQFIKRIDSNQNDLSNLAVGTKQMILTNDSIIMQIYKKNKINERYRHRYEFNQKFFKCFEGTDLLFSALKTGNQRAVALEHKNHPFFIGVQYHPEFLARPEHTHPLFDSFLMGCISEKYRRNGK